jgi:hypothetical protein
MYVLISDLVSGLCGVSGDCEIEDLRMIDLWYSNVVYLKKQQWPGQVSCVLHAKEQPTYLFSDCGVPPVCWCWCCCRGETTRTGIGLFLGSTTQDAFQYKVVRIVRRKYEQKLDNLPTSLLINKHRVHPTIQAYLSFNNPYAN